MTDHWVPQCYLRNFGAPGNRDQVFVYTKGRLPFICGVANIAAENDLYTFTDKNTGEKIRDVEEMFGTLERAVDPVLRKIAEEKTLDNLDGNRD